VPAAPDASFEPAIRPVGSTALVRTGSIGEATASIGELAHRFGCDRHGLATSLHNHAVPGAQLVGQGRWRVPGDAVRQGFDRTGRPLPDERDDAQAVEPAPSSSLVDVAQALPFVPGPELDSSGRPRPAPADHSRSLVDVSSYFSRAVAATVGVDSCERRILDKSMKPTRLGLVCILAGAASASCGTSAATPSQTGVYQKLLDTPWSIPGAGTTHRVAARPSPNSQAHHAIGQVNVVRRTPDGSGQSSVEYIVFSSPRDAKADFAAFAAALRRAVGNGSNYLPFPTKVSSFRFSKPTTVFFKEAVTGAGADPGREVVLVSVRGDVVISTIVERYPKICLAVVQPRSARSGNAACSNAHLRATMKSDEIATMNLFPRAGSHLASLS
jgi:hypothetical protein